jgi:hypothetical protein
VSRQIETDATGAYSITIDPDSYGGDHTISVAAPGFVSSSVNLSTLPGGSTITKDFTLVAPGVVQGIVEDSKGGPVVGASVSIGAKQAATDSKGTYSMTFDPGTYAVSVSQKGFLPSQVNITVPDGTAITQNFTLVTMVPGVIQGTATFDGQPAAGATVSVGSQQTTTSAKGSYSLTVDPGTYEISAIKGVLGCSDISVTVPNGTTVTQNLELVRIVPPENPPGTKNTGVDTPGHNAPTGITKQ